MSVKLYFNIFNLRGGFNVKLINYLRFKVSFFPQKLFLGLKASISGSTYRCVPVIEPLQLQLLKKIMYYLFRKHEVFFI